MGWHIARDYTEEWKAASAKEQELEDYNRGPGKIPKDEFWQKGEWGQWCDLERKLLAVRQEAMRTREKRMLSTLKDVIRKTYTPEDGQKVTDEAVERVGRSIMNPLTFYNLLPPSVLVSTDAEKEAVLEQTWEQAITASMNGHPLACIPYHEAYMIRNNDRGSTCAWTVAENWGPILGGLTEEARNWAYEACMEEAETERLIEAKRKKLPTPDALANELTMDAQDLKEYVPMMKGLRQVCHIDDKKISRLYGSTPEEIRESVGQIRAGNWIRSDTAQELIDYFKDEKRAALFGRLKDDYEWATDEKNMDYQLGLVESLLKQKDFLGRWLDFVYKEADAHQTEKIRTANQNLALLYANGRKALDMNLV